MFALIERIEPHRGGGARGPQSHERHVSDSPCHHPRVLVYSFDCLIGMPDRAGNAPRSDGSLDAASEVDDVDRFRPRKLPGITERQPSLRILPLTSIPDTLADQAVIVPDPIAAGRDPERCHALQKTRGEAPEAAIAERSIRLRRPQPREIDA